MVKPMDNISYINLSFKHFINIYLSQIFKALRNIFIGVLINWSKLYLCGNGKI